MIKRAVDVVVALLALTVSGPLWLIAAVLIKLESPGPVFFYAKTYRSELSAVFYL